MTHREDIMKKLISVCLCICIFAAQLSGCSDMSFPGSSGPTVAEKLEKIRTSDEYPEILVEMSADSGLCLQLPGAEGQAL